MNAHKVSASARRSHKCCNAIAVTKIERSLDAPALNAAVVAAGEDVVRHAGLAVGLVDVKVCASDATWSG